MAIKGLILAGVLSLFLCVGIGVDVDTVHAQGKSTAERSSTELGTKEFDQDKLPGPLEVGLGIGSIFVMIAVVKYV